MIVMGDFNIPAIDDEFYKAITSHGTNLKKTNGMTRFFITQCIQTNSQTWVDRLISSSTTSILRNFFKAI